MASDKHSSVEFTPVPSPVSEALILVCEKCGKKLVGEGEDNPSKTLQLALKDRIKEQGKKGVLRAVVTSCMDVCPKGEIAVGILRMEDGAKAREFYTVRGKVEKAADDVLERVARNR